MKRSIFALISVCFMLPCFAGETDQSAPTSQLQVSRKIGKYTLIADRAEVKSVLKLLFDQAEKQFLPDANTIGQLTMRLDGQPFRVCLDAICLQTFLKYQLDPKTGIYLITRNEQAIKESFGRMRSMNILLQRQLETLGFKVQSDQVSRGGQQGLQSNSRFKTDQNNRSATGGGGFGGNGGRLGGTFVLPQAGKNEAGQMGNSIRYQDGPVGNGVYIGTLSQFYAGNGLVMIDIPKGTNRPVIEILQDLGNQANVPVFIDPSVPVGNKFRMNGRISPRPLTDALNLVSFYGKLEWRWIGDKIFIEPLSDFLLFFGESEVPKSGPGLKIEQKLGGQQQ